MLYFKSLTEGNAYIGYKLGAESLDSILITSGKVKDFEEFLRKEGMDYNLVVAQNQNGTEYVGIRFENDKIVPFGSIISSGTKTLWLLYCWMLEFENLSMLIIDEFDAYYHYATAQSIMKMINGYENLQAVITTHNVTLMNTEVTRPDCCFLLQNGFIKPLSKLANADIRKKNNLEKMYREGKFTDVFV